MPVTIPMVVSLTVPVEECIEALNDLIVEYHNNDYELVTVIPCPGKNWPGASAYHWIVIFKPRKP